MLLHHKKAGAVVEVSADSAFALRPLLRRSWPVSSALLGLVVLASCSMDAPTPISGGSAYDPKGYDEEADGAQKEAEAADPNAPEVELEESFRAPVVQGRYLWSANPDTNKVARIDAKNLDIEVYDGGHSPTFLAALPKGPTVGGALVLNTLSDDATVFLDPVGDEEPERVILGVQEGASAWTVGEGGSYAIAWSKSDEGLLNFGDGYQDLTVFDFTGKKIVTNQVSVGFRPSQVSINADESHAYVVSDPGISVINLQSGGVIEREIFLPQNTGQQARDVVISPDGSLAMIRLSESSEILLVKTATDERATVKLGGVVTDLDLSADGQTAVAVVRGGQTGNLGVGGMGGTGTSPDDQSTVALLDVQTIFDNPQSFDVFGTEEIVGSAVVAEDASKILLFTNASANSHLSILDPLSGEFRVVELRAPVRAAFLAEDAAHAVALMSPPSGSVKQGAFAVVPVEKALAPRIEGTETEPVHVAISAESGRAVVTTEAGFEARAVTHFIHLPGLQVDRIELPSAPLATGIVPEAGQAFIAQEHAEGRATFIDLETGIEKTVTGFELSGKVVE